MNQQQDLASAVMRRERSRSRIRLATVTVGAAALAATGVVAANLPGPAHTTASAGTPASAQPSAPVYHGDDGGGDNGGDNGAVLPNGTGSQGSAHAISGGS
jgi:hypothetical protein